MKNNNVNNESAKVVENVENKKAEKKNALENIFKSFNENSKGLLTTNLGTKKSSIYKDELFENIEEKQKKSLRKKFRNMLFSVAKAIVTEKKEENKKSLIDTFNDFYTNVYKVHDYSLSSVCNENLQQEKKEVLLKALEIVKKENQ
jgi:hypothetical protein